MGECVLVYEFHEKVSISRWWYDTCGMVSKASDDVNDIQLIIVGHSKVESNNAAHAFVWGRENSETETQILNSFYANGMSKVGLLNTVFEWLRNERNPDELSWTFLWKKKLI